MGMELKRYSQRSKWITLLSFTTTLLVFGGIYRLNTKTPTARKHASYCPTPPSVRPDTYLSDNSTVRMIVEDLDFRNETIEKLLGSVRIPTESYDTELNPSEFPEQYKNFSRLHDYFKKTYPLVHQILSLESTKYEYNFVYTWEGSNPSVKPLMLAGHQDVVPVNLDTLDKWTYPPYEGAFDGKYLYGRGVTDCKSLVNSVLQAIELLLSEGFKPERTIIVAFGFDEEVGGTYGASSINEFLLEKYGEDSVYAIIDEGGNAVEEIDGTVFALPAVGEKGSLTSIIELTTPGGHSSAPPENTGIGILSDLISDVEKQPFQPSIHSNNPFLKYLYCMVEHTSTDKIPRDDIRRFEYDENSKQNVLQWVNDNYKFKWLVRTTQAADIFHSGFKVNALPELSSVFINHRINIGSSCEQTADKIFKQVEKVAERYDLGLQYQAKILVEDKGHGSIKYEPSQCLQPAPISPNHGNVDWNLFSGTVRHVLEDVVFPGKKVVVAPSITTGNTDTAKYWNLTKNIYRYRFSTSNAVLYDHVHGIDEQLNVDTYLYMITFYYEYIQNTAKCIK